MRLRIQRAASLGRILTDAHELVAKLRVASLQWPLAGWLDHVQALRWAVAIAPFASRRVDIV